MKKKNAAHVLIEPLIIIVILGIITLIFIDSIYRDRTEKIAKAKKIKIALKTNDCDNVFLSKPEPEIKNILYPSEIENATRIDGGHILIVWSRHPEAELFIRREFQNVLDYKYDQKTKTLIINRARFYGQLMGEKKGE